MRVLIVKVSSLGDIIHTLPAVTDASRANRNLVFDWAVEEAFTEVPGWHPAVENVIPVGIRRWRGHWLKSWFKGEIATFREDLQKVHYDLVIDAQGLIKSGIVSRMSKGITVGLSKKTIREPLATLFYNKVYSVPWTEHAVERVRELFSRALHYKYDPDQVDYGIDFQRLGLTAGEAAEKQLVFLHGTTWKTKNWPENYWRELAGIATQAGYRVLLPWGDESERLRAERIATDNPEVEILPRQSLTGLARHIARSSGVIAVDTGLGHLAAALSIPTLSLYGPTDPGLSGTYGSGQHHLRSNLNCSPCLKRECAYTGPGVTDEYKGDSFLVFPPCFSTLRPETVWHNFNQLIANPVATS
ncbi:MAG: lipopolysaccharide heptosyltransferase I [Gammaproteobacteria bacterium]|nr:lipopolysaccharide heptosyltransferase I [Pseudomonadales bacterium]MCP5347586.1 lipopolysaccharide heptosyltransferase I [Pseudomonadales bacterium]